MDKIWKLAHGQSIKLDNKSIIMGILNLTPDSFSDGGTIKSLDQAIQAAIQMKNDGALIIDVGGESTRPNATKISAEEEQKRILPVIKKLSEMGFIISVDTYHAQTAQAALKTGAHIINDIEGLQLEEEMAKIIADYNAGVVIMHTNRERKYELDIIEDQKVFFKKSIEIANKANISPSSIVLDPGFGFGKDFNMNIGLLARAGELKKLGYPLLVGTSRKRFVGALSGDKEPMERDCATAATSVILRMAGASIFRVHNISVNKDALAVADEVCNYNG